MASNPMYILSNSKQAKKTEKLTSLFWREKQLQEKSYLSITRGAQSLTAF